MEAIQQCGHGLENDPKNALLRLSYARWRAPGRWNSAKDALTDVATVIPFWALWEGVAYGVHYLLDGLNLSDTVAAVDGLIPKSLVEITRWILLCLTVIFFIKNDARQWQFQC